MTNDHDEKFESYLRKQAADYNAPQGDVPRDEMWTVIAAVRQKPVMARRPRYAPWLALAAAMALGVAVDRYALQGTAPALAPAAATVAVNMPDSTNRSYAVATANHLSRAEALLTSFNSSGGMSADDAQMAKWARDLLTNTRLLLDSPAGQNAERRRLLKDLELVLVQMVQRSPGAGAADDELDIKRSIERTQMLPRMRLAQTVGRNSGI